MATPTKRRRKNDFQPSPAPVRSLDFFFGKQREQQFNPVKADSSAPSTQDANGQSTDLALLADEELARHLQEEWDKEAGNEVKAACASVREETEAKDEPAVNETSKVAAQPVSNICDVSKEKQVLSLQSVSSPADDITTSVPFDETPLSFDPQKYIPDLQKSWTVTGNEASYGLLSRAFVLINSTQSRIKIVDTLTNLLRTLIEANPKSLLSAVGCSKSRVT